VFHFNTKDSIFTEFDPSIYFVESKVTSSGWDLLDSTRINDHNGFDPLSVGFDNITIGTSCVEHDMFEFKTEDMIIT
jgi:hypothetical protein